VQKLKSTPKGFTLGVKAENRKNIFNLPHKLPINAELYGLGLAPRLKKHIIEFGKPICNPRDQCSSIY
jgi:hypothetical protein